MPRKLPELMTALIEGVEPTFTVDDTAIVLDLSRHSTYDGVKTGEVASVRIGRSIKVPTSWLRQTLGIESTQNVALRDDAVSVKVAPPFSQASASKPARSSVVATAPAAKRPLSQNQRSTQPRLSAKPAQRQRAKAEVD